MYLTGSYQGGVNWQELGGYDTGADQNNRPRKRPHGGGWQNRPLQAPQDLSISAELAKILCLNESYERSKGSRIRRIIRRIRGGVYSPKPKGVFTGSKAHVKEPSIDLRPAQRRVGKEPIITAEIIAKGLDNLKRERANSNNLDTDSIFHTERKAPRIDRKVFALAACVALMISFYSCSVNSYCRYMDMTIQSLGQVEIA